MGIPVFAQHLATSTTRALINDLLLLDGSDPTGTGTPPANNTAMGQASTPWKDKSGNGYDTTTQATSTKRPTFKTSQLNSLGNIYFDGGDSLPLNSAVYNLPNGDYTIITVAKQNTAGVADRLLTMAATSNASRCVLRYATTEGLAFFNNSTGTAVSTVTGTVQTRNYNIIVARKKGTTQAISVNGGVESSNNSAANVSGIVAASLGSDGTGTGSFLTGNKSYFQAYSTSLTGVQIAKKVKELATQFGILSKGNIRLPSPITAPFDIFYDGYNFTTNVDMQSFKNVTYSNWYVNLNTGSASNAGTETSPFKNISSAIAAGNATGRPYTIFVSGATYDRNQPWNITPTQDCNIIAVNGNVILSGHEPLNLVSDGAGAYTATRSLVGAVSDALNLDARGNYKPMVQASTLAECRSTPNTYYTDGVSVWLHAFDSRDLTGNTNTTGPRVWLSTQGPIISHNVKVYLENIYSYGWLTAALNFAAPNANGGARLYWNGGAAKYNINGNNLSCNGVEESILYNVSSAYAWLDGFNYHKGNGAALRRAYEIGCSSYNNGLSGAISNNASTMHDGGIIVRAGGNYGYSRGRNIHDISTAEDGTTYSFNAGVNSFSSQDNTDSGSVNFRFGDGVSAAYTVAWVLKCLSSGSNKDVYADVDSVVNIDNSSWLYYSGANTTQSGAVIQQYTQA